MENKKMEYKSGMGDAGVIKTCCGSIIAQTRNFSTFASNPLLAYSLILECFSIMSQSQFIHYSH